MTRAKQKRSRLLRKLKNYHQTLEYRLCEILSSHAGERGDNEGAVDIPASMLLEPVQAQNEQSLVTLVNYSVERKMSRAKQKQLRAAARRRGCRAWFWSTYRSPNIWGVWPWPFSCWL